MSKQAGNKKAFTKHAYKVILAAVWLAILILCVQNRKYFTVDGVLNLSPHNTALAAAFLLFLFALKSVSIFIYSGFLFIASGILFPLPTAILLNVAGTCIMVSLPYWLGRQLGKEAIDHIVGKYPKAAALRQTRVRHEFVLSFITRAINILPSDILSLYMGAAGIRYIKYLPGSILGMALPIVTFPIMGTSITNPLSPAFLGSFAVQVAVSMIAIGGYCVYRKKNKKEAAEDETQNRDR